MFEKSSFSLAVAKCLWKYKKPTRTPPHQKNFPSPPLHNPSWHKTSCSWPVLHCNWCPFLPSPRLTLFSHLPIFVTHSGGVNSPEVTAGYLLVLPHLVASWDFSSHYLSAAVVCLCACMKSLLKEGDCRGIDLAVLGAFVNKCLTLVAGKDENQTRFTSSTMLLLGKIS